MSDVRRFLRMWVFLIACVVVLCLAIGLGLLTMFAVVYMPVLAAPILLLALTGAIAAGLVWSDR